MIRSENIASKEFRKALYGYDCEQVDLFLDELIVQLKQMEQERLEMSTTIEYLVGIVQKSNAHETEDSFVGPVSPNDLLSNTDRNVMNIPEPSEDQLVHDAESAVVSDEANTDQ